MLCGPEAPSNNLSRRLPPPADRLRFWRFRPPSRPELAYGLWAALPLAVILTIGAGSGAASWRGFLPAGVVALWALLLGSRREKSLPLAARRSAVLLLSLLAARYLQWRLGSTLNLASGPSTALSLLMLAAELALLSNGFLQLWLTWARQPPIDTEAGQAAEALARQIRLEAHRVPAVDVLVPSYGEPLELIERSLRGCLALDYPRQQVWLLDDSGRVALRALCERLGCLYLSRGDTSHAKAGNLNHALPRLDGDLIAVFDADVVPQQGFLLRSVGLFSDPRVGFVQTPQTYMNADPVARNLRLERWLMPDEENFYRWIEPTRQAVGAVVCAGTSFLMRRSALLRVGGFETATSSEDLATGIRLAAAGHRNLYLNEKLSAGLSPLSIAAMARQRGRWASGTLQVLRTGANPLRIPGLSVLQRIAYLEGILHWFNVIPQLLLLMMPLSLGLFGVAPILVNGPGLIAVALPFYLGQLLLVGWFSRGARSALLPELYRWIFLFPILGAVLSTLLGRPRRFRVTPKVIRGQVTRWPSAGLFVPLLALFILQGLNLIHLIIGPGGSAPLGEADGTGSRAATQALGLVWASISVGSLLVALRLCWDRPRCEAIPWFSVGAPLVGVGLHNAPGRAPARLMALSETGLELQLGAGAGREPLRSPLEQGIAVGGELALEWTGALAAPLPLRIARIERGKAGLRVGAAWHQLKPEQSAALQALLYRRQGQWPTRQAPFEPLALLAVLFRLLQPVAAQGWFQRSLMPLTIGPNTP